MDHDSLDLIQKATTERRVCRAYFNGEDESRIIHPYGIFRTKKGNFMIACWQEGGFSNGNEVPAFRNFDVNSCEWIEMLDRKFLSARQFNPEAPMYHEWVYHIDV
jgi:hypothetical protein